MRAWRHWDQPTFMKLRLADMQHAGLSINVSERQSHKFPKTQPSRVEQYDGQSQICWAEWRISHGFKR